MQILRDIASLRRALPADLAFVPTMGNLHEGISRSCAWRAPRARSR